VAQVIEHLWGIEFNPQYKKKEPQSNWHLFTFSVRLLISLVSLQFTHIGRSWLTAFGSVVRQNIIVAAHGTKTSHFLVAMNKRQEGIRFPTSPSRTCPQWPNGLPLDSAS
jgi:hypothetical protein